MTMFMGIVGQVLSLDDSRYQNSPGLRGFHHDQNHPSIYLGVDHVSRSLQAHDWAHSIMPWSDDLSERDIQLELDIEDIERFHLATVPAAAESVICFLLRNDERESVIGDLNERYSELYRCLGKRKADLYVYREVCRSLFPFVKRALVKFGVRSLLAELIRKLIA